MSRARLFELIRPSLQALKCHWPQLLLFQFMLLLLVIGYYGNPTIHQWCEVISAIKLRWGLLFVALTTPIAGLLLPELIKRMLRSRNLIALREFPSTMLFFAFFGICIDFEYRIFGLIFGQTPTPTVALSKMAMDQFVLTPIYNIPFFLVMFAWRQNNYQFAPTMAMLSRQWYMRSVLPLLIPCWCYWIPMTLMIYSMPASLQFSVYVLAMAAWSLILLFIARPQEPAPAREVCPS